MLALNQNVGALLNCWCIIKMSEYYETLVSYENVGPLLKFWTTIESLRSMKMLVTAQSPASLQE
jgi:hypothetical protein